MQSGSSNQRIGFGRGRGKDHWFGREMSYEEWRSVNGQHQRNIGRAGTRGLMQQYRSNRQHHRNIGRAGGSGLIQQEFRSSNIQHQRESGRAGGRGYQNWQRWQMARRPAVPVDQKISFFPNADQNITDNGDWDLSDGSIGQFDDHSDSPMDDVQPVKVDEPTDFNLRSQGIGRSSGRSRGRGLIYQNWLLNRHHQRSVGRARGRGLIPQEVPPLRERGFGIIGRGRGRKHEQWKQNDLRLRRQLFGELPDEDDESETECLGCGRSDFQAKVKPCRRCPDVEFHYGCLALWIKLTNDKPCPYCKGGRFWRRTGFEDRRITRYFRSNLLQKLARFPCHLQFWIPFVAILILNWYMTRVYPDYSAHVYRVRYGQKSALVRYRVYGLFLADQFRHVCYVACDHLLGHSDLQQNWLPRSQYGRLARLQWCPRGAIRTAHGLLGGRRAE